MGSCYKAVNAVGTTNSSQLLSLAHFFSLDYVTSELLPSCWPCAFYSCAVPHALGLYFVVSVLSMALYSVPFFIKNESA